VLRLASLLWRMRRVISIETVFFGSRPRCLRDRRTAFGGAYSASDAQIPSDKSAGWNEDPSEQGPEELQGQLGAAIDCPGAMLVGARWVCPNR
jgi:hypothetical protein